MGPNFAQTFGKVSRQHRQKAKQTPTPFPTEPDTKLWKRVTNIWAFTPRASNKQVVDRSLCAATQALKTRF